MEVGCVSMENHKLHLESILCATLGGSGNVEGFWGRGMCGLYWQHMTGLQWVLGMLKFGWRLGCQGNTHTVKFFELFLPFTLPSYYFPHTTHDLPYLFLRFHPPIFLSLRPLFLTSLVTKTFSSKLLVPCSCVYFTPFRHDTRTLLSFKASRYSNHWLVSIGN
jgi:hypothetical protein